MEQNSKTSEETACAESECFVEDQQQHLTPSFNAKKKNRNEFRCDLECYLDVLSYKREPVSNIPTFFPLN